MSESTRCRKALGFFLVLLLIGGLVSSVWVMSSIRFSHPDWTETQLFLYMVTLGGYKP